MGQERNFQLCYGKDVFEATGVENQEIIENGKKILIKALTQVIPTYCMSSFLFPKTLLDELHVMLNRFWWERDVGSSKGVKWMRWERLCVGKDASGQGFRALHLFNVALLGKMRWQLLYGSKSLVCRVLKV